MSRSLLRLFLLMVATQVSVPVYADVIAPGALVPLDGVTSAANPLLAGVVIQDTIRPFMIENSRGAVILEGELQERVTRSNTTGSLIYSPRIRNLSTPHGGDAWVMNMTFEGFEDVPVNVEYRTDGLGQVGPNSVYRTNDSDLLRFNYDPHIILPPSSGKFLSIMTPAYESVPLGKIRIMAQNDFGADVFVTQIADVSIPAFAGDANLDGRFNSADLIQMFMRGEYEDRIAGNSVWGDGDFNRDFDFNSTDLVLALATGRYEAPSMAVAAVPEPASGAGMVVGMLSCVALWRQRGRRSPSRSIFYKILT